MLEYINANILLKCNICDDLTCIRTNVRIHVSAPVLSLAQILRAYIYYIIYM